MARSSGTSRQRRTEPNPPDAISRFDAVVGASRIRPQIRGALDPVSPQRLRSLVGILAGAGSPQDKVIKIADLLHFFFDGVQLRVDSVDPKAAWLHDDVTVSYTLTNLSGAPTSGVLTAEIFDFWDLYRVATSGWRTRIDNLQAGAATSGKIEIRNWLEVSLDPKIYPSLGPGMYSVDLNFWVPDDHGSITLFSRNPLTGEAQDVTYGIAAAGWAELELYPKCEPAGPDYLKIASFTIEPATVVTDSTGATSAAGATATLSWSVDSGGFPAEGTHPGSISNVQLVGGLADPKQTKAVGATGRQTMSIGGVPVAALVQPWTLIATGNCGTVQQSLKLQVQLGPPVIVSFDATPDRVYVGDSSTLTWAVSGPPSTVVAIQGHGGDGALLFNSTRLRLAGTMSVHPSWDTKYTLSARSDGGTVSLDKWVTLVAASPSGQCTRQDLVLTNPASEFLGCFVESVCVSAGVDPLKLAEERYPGYTADYTNDVTGACG